MAEDLTSLSDSIIAQLESGMAPADTEEPKAAWDTGTILKDQSDKIAASLEKLGATPVDPSTIAKRPAPIRERTPYEVQRDFSRDPEENKVFQEEASRNQFKNLPVIKQFDERGIPLSSALQAIQGVERGAIEGIGSGARAIEGTIARFDPARGGEFADQINRDADAINQSQDQSWAPRTARGISSSLTQAIPASRLGGVPAVVSYFGASEFNQALTQAKDAGFSESDQYKYALAKGVNEAAITSVFSAAPLLLKKVPGLGNYITGGTERILSEGMKATTTKEFIKELAKDLGSETAEELTILALSNHIEDRFELNKGETPEQRDARLRQGFWDTVSQTVGSVGLAGGASAIASRLNEAKSREDRKQIADQVKDLDMGEHNELRDKFVAQPSRENLNALKAAVMPVTKPVEPQADPNFGMTQESAPDAGVAFDEPLPEPDTKPAQQTPENFSQETNVVTATEMNTDVKENRQERQGDQEGLLTQSNLEPESFAQQPLASTAAEPQPPGGSGLRGQELSTTAQQSTPGATSQPILVGPTNLTVGKSDPLQSQATELVTQGATVGGLQKELGVGFQRATDLHENAKSEPVPAEPAKPKYTPVQTPPEQMSVDQIKRELGNKPSPARMEELTKSLESKQSRTPATQEPESVATTPDVAQVKPAAPVVANETPTESNPVPVAPIASQQPSVSPNAAKPYAPIVLPTPVSQAPPVASHEVTPVQPSAATPVSPPVQRQPARPQGAGLGARRRETPAPGGMPNQTPPRPQVQAPPTTWQEAFERFTKKASPNIVPREQATAAAKTAAERLERFSGVTVVIVHSDDNQAMTAAMHLPMGEGKSVILINNKIMANAEVVTDKMVWQLVGDELTHATGIDSGNWLDREELAFWSGEYLKSVPDWYRESLLSDPVQLQKEATAMWLSNTFFQDADVQQALFNTNPSVWKQIVDALLSVFNLKPSLEKSLSPKQFAIYKALTARLIQENGNASDADAGGYTFHKLLADYKRLGNLNDAQVEAMASVWEGFARNVAKMKNANEFVAKYIKGMSEANVDGQVGILTQPDETALRLQQDGHTNGAVRLWEDGSALLYSYKTADFSTHVHEFSHIARRHLTGKDADIANAYVGATSNDWSKEQEEKFANGFERFLRDGSIDGNTLVRSLWERMKSWMVGIYQTIARGSRLDVEVSPEVQKVYAKMIGAEPGAKFEELGKQLTEKGQAMYDMVSKEIKYMYDTEDAVSEAAYKMAKAYEKAKPEVQEKLETNAADRQAYFTTAKRSTVGSMHRSERAEKRGGKGRAESLKKEGKEFSRLITADKFNYAAVADERFITKGIERAARKFQQEDAETQARLTSSKSDRVDYVKNAIDEAFAGAEEVTRIVSADFENPVTGTSLAGELADTRELSPDEEAARADLVATISEIMVDINSDPKVAMGVDAMVLTSENNPGKMSVAAVAKRHGTSPYKIKQAIAEADNKFKQALAAKGIGAPTMSPGYAALLNNSPPPPPNQTLNGDTVIHGTQAIRERLRQGPLQLAMGTGKPRSFDPTTGEKAPAEYKRSGEYVTFLANTIGYARLIAHEVGHHLSNTTTVFNFMGTKSRIDLGHIITQAANHIAANPQQDMTKFVVRLQRRNANDATIKAVLEHRFNDAMNEVIRQFGTPTQEQRLAMDDLRKLDPMVVTFTNPNHPLHRPVSRGNVEEGFAEFMRHVAEGDAATVAPNAYRQYQEWQKTQPEIAKEVESVMKMLGDYLRASPQQKMKTQIANDGHAANAAESTMKDRALTYVRSLKDNIAFDVDQSSVVRTLQSMADERGYIKRPNQLDMVTAFNVLFGSAAKHGTRAFLDGVHYIHPAQYDEKLSGLSFDQALLAAGLTIDEQDSLVEFMLAQQKLEIEDKINSVRRANGQKEYVDTDLSLDDARTIIADVQKNQELHTKFLHLHDVYVQVYRDLYDMYSKATGLPAMETPLDKYVALKRVFDDNGSLSEQGRSFTTPRTPFKSRTLGGATLPIVHPFDSLRRDINKFYDLATQHQFWTTVYNATDSDRGGADGMDGIVQRMPNDVAVTKESLEKLFPDMAKQLLAAGVSQQAIDEIDTNPFAMQVVVTMFKIIHQPSAQKGEVVHIETDYYDAATGQVVPLDKPRLVTYKWNKDMYSMLSQLGMSWKQTDIARKVPWLFNTFNFFSKTFKKFAINRNPEFAMRNRLHDQAQFMERSKETTGTERITAPLAADVDIAQWRSRSITGHKNEITDMFMFDVGSMASQGGERSRSIEGDVVHMRTKSSVKAGENNLAYRTVDALASADHAFQVGLSLMEMAPRLAEYKAAIRNDGYSIDKDGYVIETATGQRTKLPYDVRMRATSAAMDVTINFAHAGPWVQLAETICPLFSAAVTSQKQKFAYRAEMVKGLLKGDKKAMGWAAVVTGFIAAGMAEYLMNRDDEEWNEQEYWQRRQWLDLGWFRLLKGRDTGIFTNAGVAMAAAIDGRWDAAFGMLSSDIAGQRVPFADEIPVPRPLFDLGYEVWAGKDMFTGKPIDTDVEINNLLPGDRGVGRTATTSRAMGYVTGYSPNMIEHVLNRISGGAYERTMKSADSGVGFVGDVVNQRKTKSWRAKDIPMVGQFVDWNPHRRSEAEMKEAAIRTEQSIGSHKLYAPKEGEDATAWNARNTDLHNAAYRYDRAKQMRGELYGLWREAKGDNAKQDEIMKFITGTARAALKKEDAGKFPNPFAPNTMIPEYARTAVRKELADVLNKATENLLVESRKKKNGDSDMQIIAARQLLKDNGWTIPHLEGLLNESMPKWTEAKRNKLMLLRRVMR